MQQDKCWAFAYGDLTIRSLILVCGTLSAIPGELNNLIISKSFKVCQSYWLATSFSRLFSRHLLWSFSFCDPDLWTVSLVCNTSSSTQTYVKIKSTYAWQFYKADTDHRHLLVITLTLTMSQVQDTLMLTHKHPPYNFKIHPCMTKLDLLTGHKISTFVTLTGRPLVMYVAHRLDLVNISAKSFGACHNYWHFYCVTLTLGSESCWHTSLSNIPVK